MKFISILFTLVSLSIAENTYFSFFLQAANYYEKEILDNPTETAYYNRISGHEIGWKAAQIVQSYMLAREIQPSAEHDNRIKDYHKWLEEDSKWSTTIENCGLNNPEYYLANWQDDASWLVGYYVNVYKITNNPMDLQRAYQIFINSNDYWGYDFTLDDGTAIKGLCYQTQSLNDNKPAVSRAYISAQILVGLELFEQLTDEGKKCEIMELVRGYYLFMERVMKVTTAGDINSHGNVVFRPPGLYHYGAWYKNFNTNKDSRILSSVYKEADGTILESPIGALGVQLIMGSVHYWLAEILSNPDTEDYVTANTSSATKFPIPYSVLNLKYRGRVCTQLILNSMKQNVNGKWCLINTGIDPHTQGYALPKWLKYAYPHNRELRSLLMNSASLIVDNNQMSVNEPKYIDACWYDEEGCFPSTDTVVQVGDWVYEKDDDGNVITRPFPTSKKSLNVYRKDDRIEDHANALMFVLAAAYIQMLESLNPLLMLPAIN